MKGRMILLFPAQNPLTFSIMIAIKNINECLFDLGS